MFSLAQKTALVCGSTQGIGKACVDMLSKQGAKIVLLARNKDAMLVMQENNPNIVAMIQADMSDIDNLKKALQSFTISNEIDIIVNNTGGPPAGTASQAQNDDFQKAFQQHLIANHTILTHFLPILKNKKWGRVVNIISTSVKQPLPNLGVSNTIRAAVANWSKTLATELAPFGITVNNVLPGATNTQRLQNIITNKALKNNSDTQSIQTEMIEEIPMQRFAEANEIAAAVAFLCSQEASYITGINLPVDGGRTLCL